MSGEFHGQRNLADYSPWDFKESDTTGPLSLFQGRLAYILLKSNSLEAEPEAGVLVTVIDWGKGSLGKDSKENRVEQGENSKYSIPQ